MGGLYSTPSKNSISSVLNWFEWCPWLDSIKDIFSSFSDNYLPWFPDLQLLPNPKSMGIALITQSSWSTPCRQVHLSCILTPNHQLFFLTLFPFLLKHLGQQPSSLLQLSEYLSQGKGSGKYFLKKWIIHYLIMTFLIPISKKKKKFIIFLTFSC